MSAVVLGALAAFAVIVVGGAAVVALQSQRHRTLHRRVRLLARTAPGREHRARDSLSIIFRRSLDLRLMLVPAALAGGLVGGPVLGALVGGGGLGAIAMTRTVIRQHQRARYEQAVPLALDNLARSLRSGSGVDSALVEVSHRPGPVAADFAAMVNELRLGASMTDALAGWSRRRPLPSVRLAAAALILVLRTGGAPAQALDGVAATVRQSLNARETAHTHATQSRASAWVLTALPLAVTGPMVAFDPSVRAFLLGSTAGAIILVVGLALDAMGAWWMHRLIRGALA